MSPDAPILPDLLGNSGSRPDRGSRGRFGLARALGGDFSPHATYQYYMTSLSRRAFVSGLSTSGLIASWPSLALADGPPPIEQVQALMDEVYRSKTAIARIEMEIHKGTRVRKMRMKMWSKGQTHSLIVLESPERDKGTATLKVDKNLWNYLPKISRTIRIPPSMMLGSWMGSDFTNDDLVKDASYRDDFNASWGGESKSPDGWLLNMEAKPDKVGLWKRIEMIVTKDGRLPIQAKYFDRKGQLARTMYFEETKDMGGRTIPSVMRIVPADKTDQSTVMRYLEIQFDAPVPDSTFSLTRLKSIR